ncbi:MAG TPA: lysylphosphatidylglycerol synthase domain-containing protein [Rhizomicrobium sp.]|nr:lysylphosphatidylglycerol synthase domain-containing protein [Rhizomicrobium sp.]
MSDSAPKRPARTGPIVAGLIGVAGAAWLVFHLGFNGVADAALSVGWHGFLLLCLYGLANFALLGFAWLALTPPSSAARAAIFCWARAVRDSAGDVLPFSQFGGMLIGARAAMLQGISAPLAFGSTIVDITMEMIAQIAFIVTGLVILGVQLPDTGALPLVKITAISVVVAVAFAAAFVVAQRRGFSLLQRIARRLLPSAEAHAGDFERAVNDIHAHPWRLAGGLASHLLGWLSAAFGTWLTLFLIGHPLSFSSAIVIESLLCAVRSAAVFVPAALGVQEAGYALMMPLFGLPADIGLGVSLLKRAREIALAVPVLLTWQIAEGRAAFLPRNANWQGTP